MARAQHVRPVTTPLLGRPSARHAQQARPIRTAIRLLPARRVAPAPTRESARAAALVARWEQLTWTKNHPHPAASVRQVVTLLQVQSRARLVQLVQQISIAMRLHHAKLVPRVPTRQSKPLSASHAKPTRLIWTTNRPRSAKLVQSSRVSPRRGKPSASTRTGRSVTRFSLGLTLAEIGRAHV